MKNEATYLEEWIAYHHVVGVEHFFLYDNNSTDDTLERIRPMITHGLVTVVPWPMPVAQIEAYLHALRFFGATAEWMAFVDADEFIVPVSQPDLPTFLAGIDADQVLIPWRMFGFSGHQHRPPGMVTENDLSTRTSPPGERVQVKAIVRPEAIRSMSVHFGVTANGRTVDEHGVIVPEEGVLAAPTFDEVQVNHYFTKSVDEYAGRVRKGRPVGWRANVYGLEAEAALGFVDTDERILRFVETTRERLQDLQALAPLPFRYGGMFDQRYLGRNAFPFCAARLISHHLHDQQASTLTFAPVHDLAGTSDAVVVRDPKPDARCRFGASMHLADFERRLGAVRAWDLHWHAAANQRGGSAIGPGRIVLGSAGSQQAQRGDGDTVDGEGDIEAPVSGRLDRRHYAAVGTMSSTGAAKITLWTDPGTKESGTRVALPDAGTYLFVVECNDRPDRVDAVRVSLDAGDPVTITDLVVVAYG